MNSEPTTITFDNPQLPSTLKAHWLVTALANEIDNLDVPNTKRIQLSAACHFVSLEHHAGISLLFSIGYPAPALALLRPVFEAYIRGIWLSDCASDVEIDNFESGKWQSIPSIATMISKIEQTTTFDTGVLGQSRLANWETLCGFTHTGVEQVRMHLSKEAIGRNCSNDQIDEALGFAGSCAVMAGIAVASLVPSDEKALKCLEIGKKFVGA